MTPVVKGAGPPLVAPRKPSAPRRGVVIGIDQSYTGFAVVTYVLGTGQHRAVVMPPSKNDGVQRLLDIQDWLIAEVAGHSEDTRLITMEGYSMAARYGREQSGELAAAVCLALWQVFCGEPVGVPMVVAPTTLKKYVTGSGTAKKDDMKLAVFKHYGVEFRDDNLADAYGLSRIAAAVLTREYDYTYQRVVVQDLRKKMRLGRDH